MEVQCKLDQVQTNPGITSILSIVIQQAGELTPQQCQHTFNDPVYQRQALSAAQNQRQIGWTNVFIGWISKKWKKAQHTYISGSSLLDSTGRNDSSKSMNKWTNTFMASLLQYGLELWEEQNRTEQNSTWHHLERK